MIRRWLKTTGEQGVTLVEMLIVMGLLAILLVVIATVFTSAADVQSRTSNYSAIAAEGRFVMARINQDIARSTSTTTPATLGATSTSLIMVINGSTYTYALNTNKLQLTDGTGTDFVTGDDVTVSGLSFMRLGNTGGKESIRYSFTLTTTSQDHSGPDTQTFTSTVERR